MNKFTNTCYQKPIIRENFSQFLIPFSDNMPNFNLKDYIHKSYFYLEDFPPENDINELINKLLTFFDLNLDPKIAYELFSLILKCFSHLSSPPIQFYNKILDKSTQNSNYIIFTATISSNLKENKSKITSEKFYFYVNKTFNQIFSQISKSDTEKFIIFNHEIPFIFESNFVIDILLLVKLKSTFLSSFFNYILSCENISNEKLSKFLVKVARSSYFHEIPNQLLLSEVFFPNFSIDQLSFFIPEMNEEQFRSLLTYIEKTFSKEKKWNSLFAAVLIDKCICYNIKFKLINTLLFNLAPSNMTSAVWEYLEKFGIVLHQKVAQKIQNFSNPAAALRVMPNLNMIPSNVLEKGILEANDLKVYQFLFDSSIDLPKNVLSSSKFWIHILDVISSTEGSCSRDLFEQFAVRFMFFVPKENVFSVFYEMIMNRFPTKNSENEFLFDLLKAFDEDYRNEYFKNSKKLLDKIVDEKMIPYSSFWKLIDFSQLNEIEFKSPIMIYAYLSLDTCEVNKIKSITILPQTSQSNDNLIYEFLIYNDIDYIVNLNEESLSLIIAALAFTNVNDTIDIVGLNKEVILPFFALSFNFLVDNINVSNFELPEIVGMLLDSCDLLTENKSPLLTASIDIIISNFNDYCNNMKINFNRVAVKFLNKIIPLLVNNKYKADQIKLLIFIFRLSHLHILQKQIKGLFDDHGINLFIFFVQNMKKISNFDKLKDIQLDFQAFNYTKLSNTIVDIIQNSSDEEYVINTLYFIEHFCKNIPKLNFTNPQNLIKVFRSSIDKKNWDNVLLLGKIMNIDRFAHELHQFINEKIPYPQKEIIFNPNLFKINNLISAVLSDSHPEKNKAVFENLFALLMMNQSIAMDYISILFEKISFKQTIDPKMILVAYNKEYNAYGDVFVNSFRRAFQFHSSSSTFVRKSVFESISSPLSRTGIALITILYNEIEKNQCNYQAFFCLLSIASSFPFLFTQNPHQVFNVVLQAFSYSSLYFTLDNNYISDENIRKIKTALTAFEFLLASLYSVITLNLFVPWLFENILNFNDSQVLSFILILQILFNTKKIKEIMLALSKKYNFLEIIEKLLSREVNENISKYYKESILKLYSIYYNAINGLSKRKIIYVDELSRVENPFIVVFSNYSTILPIFFDQIENDFQQSSSNKITEYIKNISETRPFWIHKDCLEEELNQDVTDFSAELFVIHFVRLDCPKTKNDFSSTLPYFHIEPKVKIYRYFSTKPKWLYNIIMKKNNFPLFSEHLSILADAISDLVKIEKQNNNKEDEKDVSEVDVNSFYSNEFCCEKVFNFIINEVINDEDVSFILICSTIESLTKNKTALDCFLNLINQHILEIQSDNYLYEKMKKIVNLLYAISKNDDFKKRFADICGNNLIEVSLCGELRNDSSYLSRVSKLFCKTNEKTSLNVTHLIGFMFLLKQQKIIVDALELCGKVDYQYLCDVIKIIERYFDEELKKKHPSFSIIKSFIEKVPELAKQRESLLYDLIKNVFLSYLVSKNENSLDLLCSLFNFLAPKRTDIQKIFNEIDFSHSISEKNFNKYSITKSKQEIDYFLNQAPFEFATASPKFFSTYENYRNHINKIMRKNENIFHKLTFIHEFPELIDFQTRMSNFHRNIKSRIDQKNAILLELDRSKVLQNSFDILHDLPPDVWLNDIRIQFVGEEGVDQGGLTNEWFFLLVKELLDPKNKLFKSTKYNNYQPNPSSTKSLNYFKFAGMIIARAMMQGQYVNAHFTRSFYRQILQQNVKFDDLEDYDEDIFASLQNLFQIDVDQLELNYTIDISTNETVLLVDDGDKKVVTNENLLDYVSLYTNYHLKRSIEKQVDAFRDGFNELIPHDEIRWFLPNELDLLVCGIPEIDVNDLRRNVCYEHPYSADHRVISMFFEVIAKWKNEDLALLLHFVTGSSQVPLNGFKEYGEKGKPITIASGGDKYHWCVAHTCFNMLDLPQYENEKELNDKLRKSIQYSEFGIK